jgi:hypothetical protein
MPDIIKYIKLGTDAKEWFNYDGQALPIRPLSSYEIDEIMLKIIEDGIPPIVFKSVYKVKMNLLDENETIDINPQNYTYFFRYYNEIDYWTVYYGMKDFQDEDFSKPDYDEEYIDKYSDWDRANPKGYYIVREMKHVHDIAKDIRIMTSQPLLKLSSVLSNSDGKVLATMVHIFHQPLASKAWKLTPLQESFIYYSRRGAPQIIKDESELPGISGVISLKEVTEKLMQMGLEK